MNTVLSTVAVVAESTLVIVVDMIRVPSIQSVVVVPFIIGVIVAVIVFCTISVLLVLVFGEIVVFVVETVVVLPSVEFTESTVEATPIMLHTSGALLIGTSAGPEKSNGTNFSSPSIIRQRYKPPFGS